MIEQTTQPDYAGATAALSQALKSMQTRLDQLTAEHDPLAATRKKYLERTVQALLPAVSPRVEANLRKSVPAYVTRDVSLMFASNRKILGLFPTSHYHQALSLLQTRLAAHLDQHKYGEIAAIDNDIAGLSSEMTALRSQILKTMDLITVLQQAASLRAPLAPDAAEQVARLAQARRVGLNGMDTRASARRSIATVKTRSGAASGASHAISSSSSHSYPADDNADLWFYFMTDIPTSLRTLVINAVIEQREADSAPVATAPTFDTGAPGGWDVAPPPAADNSSQVCTADSAMSDMAAAVSGIATDDSLGHFS